MSDLVGNPEDRFSRVAAQMFLVLTETSDSVTRVLKICHESHDWNHMVDHLFSTDS